LFLFKIIKQKFGLLMLKKLTSHCKKNLLDSWTCFDQTFLRLGLGKFFPARESLASDILAGDGKTATLFLQCRHNCPLVEL